MSDDVALIFMRQRDELEAEVKRLRADLADGRQWLEARAAVLKELAETKAELAAEQIQIDAFKAKLTPRDARLVLVETIKECTKLRAELATEREARDRFIRHSEAMATKWKKAEAELAAERERREKAESDASYERSQHAEFQCHWQIEKDRADKLREVLVKARPLINGLLAPASLLAAIDALLKETE